MIVAKVTSKGQITIPKMIREALELEAGDRVLFALEGNRKVVMSPAGKRPLSTLRGIFTSDNTFTSQQEIREMIGRERGAALLQEGRNE